MLKIRKGPHTLPHKAFVFPAGEVGVKIEVDHGRWAALEGRNTVVARLQSSQDVMELVMLVDALRRLDCGPVELVLPWLPYARQDRVCCNGESHSLAAFAALINGMDFHRVKLFDPHSDVAGAVIERSTIVPQLDIIGRFDTLNRRIVNGLGSLRFISPDAGANKKVADLAAHYGHDRFLRGDKLRNLATGAFKEIVVLNPREDVEGMDVLIPDDIGDGMGTFLGLAKALKDKGARRVLVYVTHGILSKGLDMVFAGGVDELYVTNSFRTDLVSDGGVFHVMELEGAYNL